MCCVYRYAVSASKITEQDVLLAVDARAAYRADLHGLRLPAASVTVSIGLGAAEACVAERRPHL
jgi:hypothetical protein